MTNSHNRTNSHQADISGQSSSSSTKSNSSSGSNSSGRFFANNGKQHCKPGSAKKQQQQQNLANVSLNSSRGSNEKFFVSLKNGMGATSTPGKSRASPQQQHHRSSPTGVAAVQAQLSSSPPNLSHFAGSKCYDAPAPTALPKPPLHWTGSSSQDVIMSVPVLPSPPVVSKSPTSPPKSQAYYQKATKGHSAKKQQGAGVTHHQRQQHAVQHNPLVHHHQMVSCSREYLLKAVSATTSMSNGGNGDYDRFSENLKMVLNVRA